MRGVERQPLVRHADPRGVLHAFEQDGPLSFTIRRVFCITQCAPHADRGCHAVTAYQALLAAHGSVSVDLDNGSERMDVRLTAAELLVVWPGVWLRLHGFSSDAVLVVASSQTFAAVRYFDTPQPGLLESSLQRPAA